MRRLGRELERARAACGRRCGEEDPMLIRDRARFALGGLSCRPSA
jgi:hypothetical protein